VNLSNIVSSFRAVFRLLEADADNLRRDHRRCRHSFSQQTVSNDSTAGLLQPMSQIPLLKPNSHAARREVSGV
jgi:hypothetical protein